jgi:MFS family permease
MAYTAESANSVNGENRRDAIKAVAAGTIGTTIEWYDFYIYGLVAGLVFGELFFPGFDPLAGTLLAFSTYFVGFAARPLGAAIFGHFGDRIGRKATLVATLILMAVGTALVGFVPTYKTIGIWGAVFLVALRVVQGIGVGGEWSGAVLLTTEWRTFRRRRGFTGSWAQWGSPAGLVLATGMMSLVNIPGEAFFMSWGWRITFWVSILLFGVGLYIRLGILETPLFRRLVEKKSLSKRPVAEVLQRNWREIILTCLCRMGQHASFYLFTTFVLAYAVGTLQLPQQTLLNAILVAGIVSMITTPLWGHVSDLIGRKRMYIIGIVTMMVFAIPYYFALETAVVPLIIAVIILSLVVHDMQYGPQAAMIAESFPTSVRYSGSSLGYQLSSVTSAGPAPIIATYLAGKFGSSLPVGLYLVGLCVIALAATLLLRPQEELDEEEDLEPVTQAATQGRESQWSTS